jgi:hypothetical protein
MYRYVVISSIQTLYSGCCIRLLFIVRQFAENARMEHLEICKEWHNLLSIVLPVSFILFHFVLHFRPGTLSNECDVPGRNS